MKSSHSYLVCWLAVYDLALGPISLGGGRRGLLPLVAAEDIGHEDGGGGDEHEEYHHDQDDEEESTAYGSLATEPSPYDPADENPENICRRNPTWRQRGHDYSGNIDSNDDEVLLDYETCRELVGWEPRDIWWREDPYPAATWLNDGKEQQIADCLDEALSNVDGSSHWWASCNETNRSDACFVEYPMVSSQYAHVEEGDIVMVRNALTEQEAYAIESLVTCMHKLLPNEIPFYEERKFGDAADADHGLYSGDGGNFCTFVQGMVQKYLPGVASSMFHAIQLAYDQADWAEMGIPQPYELGLRTAEVLQYKKTGRLGLHQDSESIISISVALSNEDDYEGGFFHLQSDNVLFKVPRLSALVFWSESDHGVSPIRGGDRNTFVMELWDEDDVPLGTPRPGPEVFHEYQDERMAELGISANAAESPADDDDDEGEEEEAHDEL